MNPFVHLFIEHVFIECQVSVKAVYVSVNVIGIFLPQESHRVVEETDNTNTLSSWIVISKKVQ